LSFIDAVWVPRSRDWIAWLSDLAHHLGITSMSDRAPYESTIFTDPRGNWLNHWGALSPALLQRPQIGALASTLNGALGSDLLAVEGPANQKVGCASYALPLAEIAGQSQNEQLALNRKNTTCHVLLTDALRQRAST
jgi:hypothetical protein